LHVDAEEVAEEGLGDVQGDAAEEDGLQIEGVLAWAKRGDGGERERGKRRGKGWTGRTINGIQLKFSRSAAPSPFSPVLHLITANEIFPNPVNTNNSPIKMPNPGR